MDVGAIIRRIEILVAEKQLSKEEFYSASGISSASYSQWNTGVHKPTKKKLAKAAEVLGVSLEYLLSGDESAKEAQKNIPTPEGEENDCVSISIPMQKQLYEIYHAAVKQLDITDGFAVTRAGLRANILSWMKNGFCSMSRKRDLLALASVLEIESEILPLVSSLPPLEGGLLEVYRELHDLVDGIPPSKLQTVRDVLAAFSENRA